MCFLSWLALMIYTFWSEHTILDIISLCAKASPAPAHLPTARLSSLTARLQ